MFNDEIAIKKYEWFANKYNIDIAIETGTNKGLGALNLSIHHDIVITCEVEDKYFEWSSREFTREAPRCSYTLESTFNTLHNNLLVNLYQKDNKKIYMIKGSSEVVLDDVLNGGLGFDVNQSLLFYLDAHWNDYWPLKDELKLIKKYNLSDSKIIIHDFYVPGFTERIVDENGNTHFIWGCDQFNNQQINYDYVKDLLYDINPGMLSYFADDVVYNNAGRGILYSVPIEEQNFNEYLEYNRGTPCIEINSEYYSDEDIESSKIQNFEYRKLTKGIDY